MNLNVTQAHPLFAAIVTGVDISTPLTAELTERIEKLMAEYAVVCLRGSRATDEQHVDFSRMFGPLELPPDMKMRTGQKKRTGFGLFDASNLNGEGNIAEEGSMRHKYNQGNMLFHTDSSFNDLPTKWSLLLAHIIPPEGGDTEFIDTRAVYDALPDEMKERIAHMEAEHSIWHSRRRGGMTEFTPEMIKAMPAARHPMVRTSANGRKTLYVGAHAASAVGMDEAEGLALIDELNAFAAQPQFIYAHKWQEGDLLIWDNRCTLHRATGFDDQNQQRDVRRTTVSEFGAETSSTANAATA